MATGISSSRRGSIKMPLEILDIYWPFRAARLLSVLISVFTIWFSALAGKEASGSPGTGLLVGGLVGFWPMFTFRGMNVSNDALMTMLSALALYLIVRLIKRGFTWGIGILAALVAAGAFLSKINAIVLPAALLLAVVSEKAPWRAEVPARGSPGRDHAAHRRSVADPEPTHLRRAACPKRDVYDGKWVGTDTSLWLEILPFLFSLSLHHILYRRLWLDEFVPTGFGVPGLFPRGDQRGDLLGRGNPEPADGFPSLRHRLERRRTELVGGHPYQFIHGATTGTLYASYLARPGSCSTWIESRPSWSESRTRLTVGGLAVINLIILVFLVIPAYWPPVITR